MFDPLKSFRRQSSGTSCCVLSINPGNLAVQELQLSVVLSVDFSVGAKEADHTDEVSCCWLLSMPVNIVSVEWTILFSSDWLVSVSTKPTNTLSVELQVAIKCSVTGWYQCWVASCNDVFSDWLLSAPNWLAKSALGDWLLSVISWLTHSVLSCKLQ